MLRRKGSSSGRSAVESSSNRTSTGTGFVASPAPAVYVNWSAPCCSKLCQPSTVAFTHTVPEPGGVMTRALGRAGAAGRLDRGIAEVDDRVSERRVEVRARELHIRAASGRPERRRNLLHTRDRVNWTLLLLPCGVTTVTSTWPNPNPGGMSTEHSVDEVQPERGTGPTEPNQTSVVRRRREVRSGGVEAPRRPCGGRVDPGEGRIPK